MVSLSGEVGDVEDIRDGHGVSVSVRVRHGHKAFALALDGHAKSGHPPRDGLVKVNHFVTDAIVVLVGTAIAYPTVRGDVGHSGVGRTGGG